MYGTVKAYIHWAEITDTDILNKARKKKTQGLVEFRVIFTASGEVKVVNVLKRLPKGLTEEALKAVARIRFEPAVLDGNPVSQTMLLQYRFNR